MTPSQTVIVLVLVNFLTLDLLQVANAVGEKKLSGEDLKDEDKNDPKEFRNAHVESRSLPPSPAEVHEGEFSSSASVEDDEADFEIGELIQSSREEEENVVFIWKIEVMLSYLRGCT